MKVLDVLDFYELECFGEEQNGTRYHGCSRMMGMRELACHIHSVCILKLLH